jgi:hypothetical protein
MSRAAVLGAVAVQSKCTSRNVPVERPGLRHVKDGSRAVALPVEICQSKSASGNVPVEIWPYSGNYQVGGVLWKPDCRREVCIWRVVLLETVLARSVGVCLVVLVGLLVYS